MKRSIAVFFLTATLILSCSKDDKNQDEKEEPSSALIGKWNFTELDISTADAPEFIGLANEIIKQLLADGCKIMVFTFNEDETVIAETKDFTETGNDLSDLAIECPENTQTTNSTWSLDGDELTFTNEDGVEETVEIELDGDTMIVPAELVNEDNLNGAKAIFKKE